jgi:hypothetical protein
MTDTGEVCHYLEVAAVPQGSSSSTYWASGGYFGANIDGTRTEIGTGRQNSKLMNALSERNAAEFNVRFPSSNPATISSFPTAAHFNPTQYNLETIYGGKTDWFLPSKDELNELNKWVNANNYPFEDALANYEPMGALLWSSSQADANNAYFQSFAGRLPGYQPANINLPFGFVDGNGATKNLNSLLNVPFRVRFIRAF